MKHLRLGLMTGALGSVAGVLLATPAIAELGPAPDQGPSLWRVAGALMLCLLLALAGALVLRARGGLGAMPLPWSRTPATRRLKLVESIRLTPQVQLCIVSCDARELLLSTSPSGATVLGDIAALDREPLG